MHSENNSDCLRSIRNGPALLNLTKMFTASPLVVTEHGTGFLTQQGELRKSFGTHVSPAPNHVRPATAEEARDFFRRRIATRRDLGAYYARATYTGD